MFSRALSSTYSKSVARRCFSDASHKPLVDLHGLSARYANATYVAASKAGKLDQVEGELLALKDVASKNAAFAQFLDNPLISRTDKEAKIIELLSGSNASDITTNLMTTLAGNSRLGETTSIVDTYVELMKAKRGEVEAVIISADELTKAQKDAVAAAVTAQVGDGKQLVLSTQVDPSILGGLQIQIGDKFLDLSVSSKISEISRTPV